MHRLPLNIAHRGASSLAPENTMAAFYKAIEVGAQGIELDVQLSKDGIPVIIHDEILQRTTSGTGFVKGYTLAELKQLDAGTSFSTEFAGERIPTLEEALQLAQKYNLFLNVELKNGVVLYPGIEQIVADMIRTYRYEANTIVSSFNHYSLLEMKKIAPQIKTGVLYMSALVDPWKYAAKLGAQALHPFYITLINQSEEQIQRLRDSGLMINPFTVDQEAEMLALIRMGVDGIITNFPQRLNDLLRKVAQYEI